VWQQVFPYELHEKMAEKRLSGSPLGFLKRLFSGNEKNQQV
jgi:hypothetical protein